MVGVAVKVTLPPEQTGFAEALITILTGRFGFMVTVIGYTMLVHPKMVLLMVKLPL